MEDEEGDWVRKEGVKRREEDEGREEEGGRDQRGWSSSVAVLCLAKLELRIRRKRCHNIVDKYLHIEPLAGEQLERQFVSCLFNRTLIGCRRIGADRCLFTGQARDAHDATGTGGADLPGKLGDSFIKGHKTATFYVPERTQETPASSQRATRGMVSPPIHPYYTLSSSNRQDKNCTESREHARATKYDL